MRSVARRALKSLIALFVHFTMRLEVGGREHLPSSGSAMVIANHFSWFEVVIMLHLLPEIPAVFATTELQRFVVFRLLMRVLTIIPVWRGQVDRAALREALEVLAGNGVLGVFPEGGVDPEIQADVRRGERMDSAEGHFVRDPAVLIQAPSGAAYLADKSHAPILPMAFLGTESILDNLRRLRRTPVTIAIGAPFGPLAVPAAARGPERRRALANLTALMMWHIARLLPASRRGPYQSLPQNHAIFVESSGQ